MIAFWQAGRAAITFLTRLPVGGFPYSEAAWRWTPAWFPAIGAGLGALYAGVWLGAEPALGAPVAAVLVLVAALLVTGAFHEDGLADTADALGGGMTRDRVLDILKDSRIGAFGAAALIVALMLRAALLVRLGPAAPAALIACECASRLPPVWMMATMRYVTRDPEARSRILVGARARQAIVATLLAAAVLATGVAAAGWTAAAALAAPVAAAAVAAVAAWRFHARLGGITGDFLGATQQAGVCAALAAFAAA